MAEIKLPLPQQGSDLKQSVNNLFDTVLMLRKELEFALLNLDSDNIPTLNNIVGDLSDAYSLISQNATDITLKVAKTGVINSINLSTEGIKISANKLDIEGLVTFSNLTDGTTTISGANIKTGEISSINVVGGNIFDPTKTTHITMGVGRMTIKNDNADQGMTIDCNALGNIELKSVTGNDEYGILISQEGYTYPENIWDFNGCTVLGINVTAVFG